MPLFGTMPTSNAARTLFCSLVLLFGLTALFLRLHPYHGIWHDAVIYTMLALRQLEPEALGGDIFFRYGSQGSFTAFPLLHAAAIRELGLEQAAWWLTRAANLTWVCCALLLARRLLDRTDAWLATALLIAIPAYYGAGSVFAYDESFVTPRTLTEAATLLALWAALERHWYWVAAASATALALHPIMAAPGIVLVLALADPARASRRLLGAAAVGLLAAAVVAWFMPVGPLRLMDAQWRAGLETLQSYLTTNQWSLTDWQRAVVGATTLVLARLTLAPGRQRDLAVYALLVGTAGMALTLLANTVLPIALLAQGQPWRWMWLAKVVAVVLLVPIGRALWSGGLEGKGVLALLAVAWMGSEDALGLEAALCALLACVLWLRAPRPVLYLGPISLALAALLGIGIYLLIGLPPWCLAAAVAGVAWWVMFRSASPVPLYALALLAAAAAASQAVRSSNAPVSTDYDQLARAVRPWAALIRADQNVLFLTNTNAAWLALRRRSYLVTAGLVFAKDTTLEARRRLAKVAGPDNPTAPWQVDSLPSFMPPPPPLSDLIGLCAEPDLDFVVLPYSYPVRHVVANVGAPYYALFLYDCRDVAGNRGRGH